MRGVSAVVSTLIVTAVLVAAVSVLALTFLKRAHAHPLAMRSAEVSVWGYTFSNGSFSGYKVCVVNPSDADVVVGGVGHSGKYLWRGRITVGPHGVKCLVIGNSSVRGYVGLLAPGDVIDALSGRLLVDGVVYYYSAGSSYGNLSFSNAFIPWLGDPYASKVLHAGRQVNYNSSDALLDYGGSGVGISLPLYLGPGSLDLLLAGGLGGGYVWLVNASGNYSVVVGEPSRYLRIRFASGKVVTYSAPGGPYMVLGNRSARGDYVLYAGNGTVVVDGYRVRNSPSGNLYLSLDGGGGKVVALRYRMNVTARVIDRMLIRPYFNMTHGPSAQWSGRITQYYTVPVGGKYMIFLGFDDGWYEYHGLWRQFSNIDIYVNGHRLHPSWRPKVVLLPDPGGWRTSTCYVFRERGGVLYVGECGYGTYRIWAGFAAFVNLSKGDRVLLSFNFRAGADYYEADMGNICYGIALVDYEAPIITFAQNGGPYVTIYTRTGRVRVWDDYGDTTWYKIGVRPANSVWAPVDSPALAFLNPNPRRLWVFTLHDEGRTYRFVIPPVSNATGLTRDYLILFGGYYDPWTYPEWLRGAVRVTSYGDGRYRISFLYRGAYGKLFLGNNLVDNDSVVEFRRVGGDYYELGMPVVSAVVREVAVFRSRYLTVLAPEGSLACLVMLNRGSTQLGCVKAGPHGARFDMIKYGVLKVFRGEVLVRSSAPPPLPTPLWVYAVVGGSPRRFKVLWVPGPLEGAAYSAPSGGKGVINATDYEGVWVKASRLKHLTLTDGRTTVELTVKDRVLYVVINGSRTASAPFNGSVYVEWRRDGLYISSAGSGTALPVTLTGDVVRVSFNGGGCIYGVVR